jgi:hypothetical protein
MFHGLSFAYAPSFLPGLTLSVDRVCLVSWDMENLKYMFPSDSNDYEDQKISFGMSWIFPQVGFEIYGELGIDDTINGKIPGYTRNPFHTTVYTAGLRKSFAIIPKKQIYGELVFEFNWMEMTQEFQFSWPYSFYFHHINTHGYTNRGQILGNPVSPGGNSQYLGFKFYYPKGNTLLFIARNNPDNNYLYAKAVEAEATGDNLKEKYGLSFKANFLLGVNTLYELSPLLFLSGGLTYNPIINPDYNITESNGYKINYLHNVSIQLGLNLKL